MGSRTVYQVSAASVLAAALVLAGCSSPVGPHGGAPGTGSSTPAPSPGTTYQGVSFTDNTVVLDAAAVRNGLHSEDGVTYRFAPGTPGLAALRPGRVVLMSGKALRKVTTVASEGGETVVGTTAAQLNEAIRTGTVGWSQPVNWSQVPRSAYQKAALDAGLHPRAFEAAWVRPLGSAPIGFKGEVSGFEVELNLTPTPGGSLDFDMSAGRSNISVAAKGSISSFVSESELRYNAATAQLFTSTVRGLKGDASLEWHAIGVGSAFDNDTPSFTLPFSVPIPIEVGPLPMILTVKSAIRFAPVLVAQSSSGGSFKVSYDSDFGFQLASSKAVPQSTVRSTSATLGDKETVTAGFQPVGFGWGWQFPRLELSLAGTGTYAGLSFDTYMAGEFTPGTTLSSQIPPCQRAEITLHAIALYNVAVLGLKAAGSQTTLWEKKQDFYKGNKPCTLTGGP
jgi:hypothetical protein